jgi:geranylgeranyl reductase family protein
MMENSFDVLIIGAGPAGSSAAIALARKGYEVALVDKQQFPREKICGDFVNPINWPILENLVVVERVLARPHSEVTGFRITSHSGAEAQTLFKSATQQRTIGLGLRRAHLDQVLVDRTAELGVAVRFGCRVAGINRTQQGWRVALGTEEILSARLLIGADGRNSWVAQQLGLNSAASTHGRCIGFQTRLRSPGAAAGKIEIHLFPGGYAGLVALGDGTASLGLAIDRSKLPGEKTEEFLLTECLPQNPHLKMILQKSERVAELRSAYPVYFSTRRCYTGGAVLAGDAARVSEPISGEGVFFAMQSGLLAAETLDYALRSGEVSADCLRRYEQACAQAFRPRFMLNSLLRFAIYRPALLTPLIRLSEKNSRVLSSLVDRVCQPQAVR